MIRYLGIQRLAVIESLEVEFGPGLTVLTGETGAGKSIVVGAIGLLAGARAFPGLVRTGEQSAVIQAVFERPDGTELTLRREISAQGRSRAFLDGALTPLAVLKETTSALVDLHGQHDHQRLLEPRYQLDLLDAFGVLGDRRAATRRAFEALVEGRARLEQLRDATRSAAERIEYLDFQLAEIAKVAPVVGEDETLQTTRRVLGNVERLRELSTEIYQRLYEGDGAVLAELGAVWRLLGELADLDPAFASHLAIRTEVESRLEDMSFDLRNYADRLETPSISLEDVEARLAAIEHLKRKHGGSLEAVLKRQEELQAERDLNVNASDEADRLAVVVESARKAYLSAAERLSEGRREVAQRLARRLEEVLAELAMSGARCDFQFEPHVDDESRWSASGIDVAELLLSANPGEELRPLARVASGGELSRVMLGLKTIASADAPGKTLVFDEVDAGIGGEVANAVARRLRELGECFQVLCITHLPQIAAAGSAHHSVEKVVEGNRTVTRIRALDRDGRAAEISRMIAGASDTSGIRRSAEELLETMSKDPAKGESERAKAKGGLFD